LGKMEDSKIKRVKIEIVGESERKIVYDDFL
jgi:hypothetical protein